MDERFEPFFVRYTRLVPEGDVLAALKGQLESELPRFIAISEADASRVHPPYGWTIKQVIGHLVDTELVFAYRACRFSRDDQTPLPGFDQDAFVAASNFNERRLVEIVEELMLLRRANVAMFIGMPPGAWTQRGTASDIVWSVEDLARAMVGHVRYHAAIVDQRLVPT